MVEEEAEAAAVAPLEPSAWDLSTFSLESSLNSAAPPFTPSFGDSRDGIGCRHQTVPAPDAISAAVD